MCYAWRTRAGKRVCTAASVCRGRSGPQVRRFTGSVDASRHCDFGRVLLSPSRLFINSRVIGIIIDKLMFATFIFSRLLWPIVQFTYLYIIFDVVDNRNLNYVIELQLQSVEVFFSSCKINAIFYWFKFLSKKALNFLLNSVAFINHEYFLL